MVLAAGRHVLCEQRHICSLLGCPVKFTPGSGRTWWPSPEQAAGLPAIEPYMHLCCLLMMSRLCNCFSSGYPV